MNGKFKGTFKWTSSGARREVGEGGVIWAGTFSGSFDNPGGFMDGTSWVCLGFTENLDDKPQASNGYLVVTDGAQSKAWATWTGVPANAKGAISGTARWIDGEGDWPNLKGTMRYSGQATPGTPDGSVEVDGNWHIDESAASA
jgi:hypothetical protein